MLDWASKPSSFFLSLFSRTWICKFPIGLVYRKTPSCYVSYFWAALLRNVSVEIQLRYSGSATTTTKQTRKSTMQILSGLISVVA